MPTRKGEEASGFDSRPAARHQTDTLPTLRYQKPYAAENQRNYACGRRRAPCTRPQTPSRTSSSDRDLGEGGAMDKAISRRRMLKRIGAGAAVAWSAPVLSSFSTPAFAQYPSLCTTPCEACLSSIAEVCGTDSVRGGTCLCSQTAEGACVCTAGDDCAEWGLCTTSADCAPGLVCKPVGCTLCSGGGMTCTRPCGAPLPTRQRRATAGTRMSG